MRSLWIHLGNFPAESWSTYFFVRFNQVLHFLQRRDKLSSIFLWIWIYFSIPASLLFFDVFQSETVTFIPFWHPVSTDRSYSTLSKEAEFGKSVKRRDDLMSHDCFKSHSRWTSSDMDDCSESYDRPRIPTSYLRPWPSGPHVFLIRPDLQCSLTSDMRTRDCK